MSITLLHETELTLNEMKNLRAGVTSLCNNLSSFEKYTLSSSCHKGSKKQNLYVSEKGSKRRYLRKGEAEFVKAIKAAKYCRRQLEIVDRNISLLEDIEREFIIPDHENITNLLPKVYRSETVPGEIQSSVSAAEWKSLKEAEKAKYPLHRPEDLTHTALDGTKMRSLSEVTIANYLLSIGVTFVYELPLIINGQKVLPDFTILSPIDNKTVIMIEHQGAMGNEQYHYKYIRTLLFYLGTDLVPNRDVFFTFNHLNGNLDLSQIDAILHTAFGFKPDNKVMRS